MICLLLLGAGLAAQPGSRAAQPGSDDGPDKAAVAKLNSILLTLNGATSSAVSRQFADAILSMAESYHKPSRPSVVRFSEELANGLALKELPVKPISQVSASIVEVLESAGVGTYKLKESVERARQALVALGLMGGNARSIAELLLTIGKEVRGPEDMPVQRFLRIQR
jgi:hypothetical protein